MLLSDIGEDSSALFCLTDRTRCCSTTAGGERRGAWRFPNGSEIMQESMSKDIYRDRSYSSISLSRRNNAVGPTGKYTCEMPDAGNTLRTLYVEISASSNQGVFSMSCNLVSETSPQCLVMSIEICEIYMWV